MSTHHEQAVLLAQSLAPDVDPQVRVIADQITVSQTAEVATMHGWLTLFGQPFTPPSPMSGMAMRSSPMPGMASISEITRLSQLHGRDSEILFLQLMIRHHRGGIDMAQAAYDGPLQEPIRRMALDMIQQQGNEIGEMTALLATRSAQPLAYP